MVTKIQALYPTITANQVYSQWRELSRAHWHRDKEQITSAKILLGEYQPDVDLFTLTGLPDGVEALAWGMKKVIDRLRGKVVEIAIDATCKHISCREKLRLTLSSSQTIQTPVILNYTA